MSKNQTRNFNALSHQHYKRVVRRDQKVREKMRTRRGVTWNLKGKTMISLGHASMMVMDGREDERSRTGERIDLMCVTAQSRTKGGMVHYDRMRMLHDWSRNPFEGAKGCTLDPREDGTPAGKGEKPNASWCRDAMELDRRMLNSLDSSMVFGFNPQVPKVWACFPSMDAIDMIDSPELREAVAENLNMSKEKLNALPLDEFTALAASVWPNLWRAPGAEGNETSCWLIPHRYVSNLDYVDRVEDFSEMLGVPIFNPVRELDKASLTMQNPAISVAKRLKLDITQLQTALKAGSETEEQVVETADGPQFVSDYDKVVDQYMSLRTGIREQLGQLSRDFTDEQLDWSICDPSAPLVVSSPQALRRAPDAEAVRVVREHLLQTRMLFADGITDDDIRDAISNPQGPLFASRQCQFQVLNKDMANPAFDFVDSYEKVTGHISYENWNARK
jgi:hypothetical protein